MTDPKEFWENKILSWEEGRYNLSESSYSSTKLEKIANKGSNSLRFRIEKCGEILSKHVSGKDVVEIGCGRGLLVPRLMAAGAKSYLGVDLAESAIAAAKSLHEDAIKSGSINFVQGSVNSLPETNAEIVFSLGLLDWLNDEELTTLFNWRRDADHFHAIAERKLSIAQALHKIYVFISYGYRTKGYVPRYYTIDEILEHMSCLSSPKRDIFRDGRLTFGAFVSTLPIGKRTRDF